MREWIVGRNPVYEVLRANRRQVFRLLVASGAEEKGRLAEIIQIAAAQKVPVQHVLRSQVDNLGENPQGVGLEASGYPYIDIQDIIEHAKERQQALFVLMLDQVQNPQNLGSLMRTAEAVGVDGIVMPLARAVGVTPAVVSASAGASEHLLVAQSNLSQAIETFKQEDAWVVGMDGDPKQAKQVGEVPLTGPLVIVVGSEGEGIHSLVRSSCDFLLRLPMIGKIASLNAAVAGSVALYLAFQARSAQK
ncbi:MAG: 23S rRNA (guanosine(2251)-2'-O)-methyltransferase RlmB [Anaerolineaceae bacterium]|jgi:23S rRNA (guanosine2251-2'-O)-methyltransferase